MDRGHVSRGKSKMFKMNAKSGTSAGRESAGVPESRILRSALSRSGMSACVRCESSDFK